MGLIAMSERDLQRIEVLSKVVDGRMTIVSAARVLAVSTRQVRRLLDVFEQHGAAAIRHKARGRPSNNRVATVCVIMPWRSCASAMPISVRPWRPRSSPKSMG